MKLLSSLLMGAAGVAVHLALLGAGVWLVFTVAVPWVNHFGWPAPVTFVAWIVAAQIVLGIGVIVYQTALGAAVMVVALPAMGIAWLTDRLAAGKASR